MVWQMAVGMGLEALAAEEARDAAIQGSEASAEMQAANRTFQESLFDQEMARLRPRYETGLTQGLPLMGQYMQEGGIGHRPEGAQPYAQPQSNALVTQGPNAGFNDEQLRAKVMELSGGGMSPEDISALGRQYGYGDRLQAMFPNNYVAAPGGMTGGTDTGGMPTGPGDVSADPYQKRYLEDFPLYNMQAQAGAAGMEGMGSYATNRFTEGLDSAENEAGYNRLQDMLQISLGASELAGSGAQNFATSQANSLINTGNALTSGAMGAGNIRNSMYNNIAGQASSIPAYMSQNNFNRQQNDLYGQQQLSGPTTRNGLRLA